MSELLKIIVPESVVYAGFPAIVFASVDFPEPLWPDNSTRSPVFIFMFISYLSNSYNAGTNHPRIVGTANENAIDVKSERPVFSSLAPTKKIA